MKMFKDREKRRREGKMKQLHTKLERRVEKLANDHPERERETVIIKLLPLITGIDFVFGLKQSLR